MKKQNERAKNPRAYIKELVAEFDATFGERLGFDGETPLSDYDEIGARMFTREEHPTDIPPAPGLDPIWLARIALKAGYMMGYKDGIKASTK